MRMDIHKIAAHLESIDLTLDSFADLVDLIPQSVFQNVGRQRMKT